METSLVASDDGKAGLTGRARSLANLKPIPKGVSLNPSGKHGPTRREIFVKLMQEPDEDEPGRTRFEAMVVAMAKNAKLGQGNDGKALLDQYMPKQAPAPTALEYAEHLRNIEADRTRLALAILGERLKTMDGKEVGAFLRECSVGADVFLTMARKLQEVVDEPAQPESLPPIEAQETPQGSFDGIARTSIAPTPLPTGPEYPGVTEKDVEKFFEQSSESATVEPNGWNDK